MGGRFVGTGRKRIKPRTRLAMLYLSLCLTTSSDPDGWKNGWMDEPMTVKERRDGTRWASLSLSHITGPRKEPVAGRRGGTCLMRMIPAHTRNEIG